MTDGSSDEEQPKRPRSKYGSGKPVFLRYPDNWDELTDAEQNEVALQMADELQRQLLRDTEETEPK